MYSTSWSALDVRPRMLLNHVLNRLRIAKQTDTKRTSFSVARGMRTNAYVPIFMTCVCLLMTVLCKGQVHIDVLICSNPLRPIAAYSS